MLLRFHLQNKRKRWLSHSLQIEKLNGKLNLVLHIVPFSKGPTIIQPSVQVIVGNDNSLDTRFFSVKCTHEPCVNFSRLTIY